MAMDLKNVFDLRSLGGLLGCSAQQLGYYIYKRDLNNQYKRFTIRKRSGGSREIRAPSTNLKIIQRNLSNELSKLFRFRSSVTGFVKGRGITRNASAHVGQRHVLNIDLEDFFGTINYGRIYGVLSKKPHSIAPNVAAAIAKACTLDNALPQGAPTSPVLSNLVCAKMDAELSRFAAVNRCVYTRYADDMTFSTNRKVMPLAALGIDADGQPTTEIAKALRDIIEGNGFKINEKKSRIASRGRRQIVTGLVVNKRVNLRRTAVREIRAMLHAWKKFGFDDANRVFQGKYGGNGRDFESVLRGKIGYVGQIRGRPDAIFKKYAMQFNQLAVGGKIRTELSSSEVANQAVWVIESDGDTQGTAFFLNGVGIVTCAHCLGENPYIYHYADHSRHFSVKVSAIDSDRDLAILEIPEELSGVALLDLHQGAALPNGSDITLLGYPNHFGATPIRVEGGKLIRVFPKSGVTHMEISAKIIGGNSGGPVLDEHYGVVGVAVLGLGNSTRLTSAEFLAVSIEELQHLIS